MSPSALPSPVPSRQQRPDIEVTERPATPQAGNGTATGVPVTSSGEFPDDVAIGAQTAQSLGMTGAVGRTLVCADPSGSPVVLYGVGDPGALDASALRDAAAAYAQAAHAARLELVLPEGPLLTAEAAAQAAVEGVLLARYGYEPLKATPSVTPVGSLRLLVDAASVEAAQRGAERGLVYARATALARDLANAPPNMLTAAGMAECAARLAAEAGFGIEVFDEEALTGLGCGGLLGVNAGSSEPPRMIKLSYAPANSDAPRLTLVGKGIMYDSGGISLKPSDAVHATMKNDMSGAGAILAAMTALPELACPTAVTAYLMCTDNMPSGTATKLGDVLSIRGGTTVEVLNTDAEGRLVMADALVLATEEPTDAIVDIATLTGACLRALGAEIAGVFGNDQPLVTQVLAAARDTGEPAWQLPLARRYRAELDSDVADIKNMSGPNGAAIHAALFLEDFVAGVPWAHIDIAGPAQNDKAASWRPRGCTGFGARLLTELALNFRPVRNS
ncbi:leucyl aminopeptidase [Streptomyces sp. NPDC005761]|uniref:leucyl aminopeptidase n=1 Tax=unclassified Streptomyces TaxID=2593676 RepID=UPI0033CC3FF6